MEYLYNEKKLGASFILVSGQAIHEKLNGSSRFLKFLWNKGTEEINIKVNHFQVSIKPNHVACTTYHQEVRIPHDSKDLVVLLFNREFYCIHTFDQEVSCNGLLFFGSDFTPILQLDPDETEKLSNLLQVLQQEFIIHDVNQEEMLRILLKRFIIRLTRLARKQLLKNSEKQEEIDLVRSFNVLVEEHYKEKKSVAEYAELLHKSPKTLSNVFSKVSHTSPLQVIHERIATEAKRLLIYTELPIKSIGYELGYEEYPQFSKFFKKTTGMSPVDFRSSGIGLPSRN
ncbi:helix-turn-helix domain-containing protein [Mongoliitalea daihaiensis]|uniref:helix-turn-helix domain-containing protein n=1 Tax=Mongoliitalea daihaiensis TaxID=2782006 RepID=UPI001F25AE53|nr:AraC family transcriptional regulator [Mongoliitalea daihaiensis]UJP65768.1 helix-turn-helix domain-containing protein [Mongoliitalea daihaiensis]